MEIEKINTIRIPLSINVFDPPYCTGRNGTFEIKELIVSISRGRADIKAVSRERGVILNGGINIHKADLLELAKQIDELERK